MTHAEIEAAIKQLWTTGWGAIHGAGPTFIPTAFDNTAFDTVDLWCRLTIVPSVRGRTTQGRLHAKYETRGAIMVQLFGPPNQGEDDELAALADEAIGVLEERRIGSLSIYESSPPRRDDTDPRWSQRTISIPYVCEQQR